MLEKEPVNSERITPSFITYKIILLRHRQQPVIKHFIEHRLTVMGLHPALFTVNRSAVIPLPCVQPVAVTAPITGGKCSEAEFRFIGTCSGLQQIILENRRLANDATDP